jgi:hypothetical protein
LDKPTNDQGCGLDHKEVARRMEHPVEAQGHSEVCPIVGVAQIACLSRHETALAALVLLVLFLLFFYQAVFGGKVLVPLDIAYNIDALWMKARPPDFAGAQNGLITDQVTEYYPWKTFVREAIRGGQVPLWNPYSYCGHPLLANYQSAVFYPINLVHYILPLEQSFVVAAILRLLTAAIFTFLLGRELGLTPYGAMLSAVVFALSGPMVVWLGFPHSLVIIWLPALLWFSERALTRRQVRYIILTGIVLGIQFLGGHPETSVHIGLVWVLYVLWRGIPQARCTGFARGAGFLLQFLLLALILGVALAAVEVLPFLDALRDSFVLAARSARMLSFRLWNPEDWWMWVTLVLLVFPDFLGSPVLGHRKFWYPYSDYNELALYVGVIPLLLALVGLAAWRRDWRSRLFAIVAVLALGIAVQAPIFVLLDKLPPLSMMANGRLRMVFVFAAALLAGLGADRLRRDDPAGVLPPVEKLSWGLALVSLPLALLAGRARVLLSTGDFPPANPGQVFLDAVKGINAEFIQSLGRKHDWVILLPFLLLLFFAFALSLRARARLGGQALMLIIIGLTVADLFLVGMDYNPAVHPPDERLLRLDAVAFVQERTRGVERVLGIGYTMSPSTSVIFKLADIRGYDPIVSNRYYRFSEILPGREGFGREGFILHQADSPAPVAQAQAKLLNLLGVKYFLSPKPLQIEGVNLVYDKDLKVYENQLALPRAFLVTRYEVLPPNQALERLQDPSFDPASVVLLEEAPPSGWPAPAPGSSAEDSDASSGGGQARIQEYGINDAVIEVETAMPAFLVMSDSYAPGWTASVDGAVTPLYVADYILRAVPVPAGSHVVRFVYSPLSFRIGVGLSLGALLVVVALITFQATSRYPPGWW